VDFDSFAVRITSVPGIADTDWLTLAPGISVLAGRNNVGKTRALRFINSLPGAWLSTPQAAPQVTVTRGEQTVTADLRGVPAPRQYTLARQGVLEYEIQWNHTQNAWDLVNAVQSTHVQHYGASPPATIGTMPGLPGVEMVKSAIDSLTYFPPHRVVETEGATQPVMVPNPNGSDLARVVYHHRGNTTPQFFEIQSVLCEMLPEIDQILAAPTGMHHIALQVHDRFADMNVPLSEAGTGVGQLLHLIASVILLPAPRTLLIEEPHVYLHPGAERVLAAFLRAHPEHAYVIVSHSPIFLNALEPDRIWLARRDQRGTSIAPVLNEDVALRHVMIELDIRPGDVALSERVIFVEGSTDVPTYRAILQKLGWNLESLGITVIGIHGAGNASSLQSVLRQLARLLNMDYVVCLDGDQKLGVGGVPNVAYLPEEDIEGVLIRDARAVHLGFQHVVSTSAGDASSSVWTAADIGTYISDYQTSKPAAKGSKILADLGHEMGLVFKKPLHDVAIATHMGIEHLADLKPLFQPLLGLPTE
jgi:hypothetical protein